MVVTAISTAIKSLQKTRREGCSLFYFLNGLYQSPLAYILDRSRDYPKNNIQYVIHSYIKGHMHHNHHKRQPEMPANSSANLNGQSP